MIVGTPTAAPTADGVLVEGPAPLRPSPRAAAPLLLFETPLEAETFLGAIKSERNPKRIEEIEQKIGEGS